MKKFVYIKKFLIGVVIGVAAITPGVSGGVIAATLGIYEEIVKSISNLHKDFKKNIVFLLPYTIGGGAGIVFFANILKQFLLYSHFELMYIFTGLITGTIPWYIKDSNKKGFKFSYLLATLISVVICIYTSAAVSSINLSVNNNSIRLVIAGAVVSLGTIIPGLSSSLLLMKLELYNEYIGIISSVDFSGIAYIAVGFLLVAIFLTKAVAYLYKKAYGIFSYFILGLLISSILMMFPGLRASRMAMVDISLMYISFVLSFLLMSFKPQV